MAKSRLVPVAVLFFLSPIVGELLSGSSPPTLFFQPVTLLLLAGLYGGGTILVRETVRRWAGVNWVWAEWLTIYHAIYSITIPILLVELLFPSFRSTAYLGGKRMAFFLMLISLVSTLFHFLHEQPPEELPESETRRFLA